MYTVEAPLAYVRLTDGSVAALETGDVTPENVDPDHARQLVDKGVLTAGGDLPADGQASEQPVAGAVATPAIAEAGMGEVPVGGAVADPSPGKRGRRTPTGDA